MHVARLDDRKYLKGIGIMMRILKSLLREFEIYFSVNLDPLPRLAAVR